MTFNIKAVYFCAGLLVAGILSGILVGEGLDTPAPVAAKQAAPAVNASASVRPAAQKRGDEMAAKDFSRIDKENRELKTENRQLQGKMVDLLNWILTNFKGKYPLPDQYFSKLQVVPLTDNFELSSEAADLFKISADEQGQMNESFAYAKEFLTDIENATLVVSNPRPDKVILRIPAFPREGEVLRDDLYAALEITLGADRFDRFLEVTEAGLKSNFYHFGEAERTMVFELAYTSDDSLPQLKIKDGWVIEAGPNSRMVTASETYVTNLPQKYTAYLNWLPDYVSFYAGP